MAKFKDVIEKNKKDKSDKNEKTVVVYNKGLRTYIVGGNIKIRPGDNTVPEAIAKTICKSYNGELRIMTAAK